MFGDAKGSKQQETFLHTHDELPTPMGVGFSTQGRSLDTPNL